MKIHNVNILCKIRQLCIWKKHERVKREFTQQIENLLRIFFFKIIKILFKIESWVSSKGGHSKLHWYLLPDGELVLRIASQIIQQTIDTLAQTLASRKLHLTEHVSQAVSSFCWKILKMNFKKNCHSQFSLINASLLTLLCYNVTQKKRQMKCSNTLWFITKQYKNFDKKTMFMDHISLKSKPFISELNSCSKFLFVFLL